MLTSAIPISHIPRISCSSGVYAGDDVSGHKKECDDYIVEMGEILVAIMDKKCEINEYEHEKIHRGWEGKWGLESSYQEHKLETLEYDLENLKKRLKLAQVGIHGTCRMAR